MTLLVGALTGQHELSEDDRQLVGEWMIDHADEAGVRDLLIKIVRTQIGDTSEFRVKVAEAIRDRFRSAPTGSATDQNQ
jgi:tetrahydromethanopterin S-methyltransferase subunit H